MSEANVLKVLSDHEVGRVHEAALKVLAECGVFIDYPRALEHLAAHGADVDMATGRVRMSPRLVERALATSPSSFILYDREGEEAFEVGGTGVHFATSSCAVRYQEEAQGDAMPGAGGAVSRPVVRSSTAADLVRLTRVAEALPQIDLASTQVVAAEAPKTLADSYRLYLVLTNTAKPVITGAFTERGLHDMKALLDALAGDTAGTGGGGPAPDGGNSADAPSAIFDVCPSPPLKWTAISAANIMDAAGAGLPVEFVSMPMPGAATPVTLAGSVVVHAAETLSGVVLAQTVRKGAKMVWGGAPVGFDMRYGTAPLSAVEATLIAVAYAQMGRHYGLPTHTYAGLSDSKLVDAQAGLETAVSGTLAALARVNLIAGAGALDFVGTQSLEKLALDAEACGFIQRALRGVETGPESLATDLIATLGPGGDYLGQVHTRRHFREEAYLPGPVIDRLDRKAWEARGGTSASSRAREKVEAVLAQPNPRPLDPERSARLGRAMKAIMRAGGCPTLPFVG